jgi:hypothetical protein
LSRAALLQIAGERRPGNVADTADRDRAGIGQLARIPEADFITGLEQAGFAVVEFVAAIMGNMDRSGDGTGVDDLDVRFVIEGGPDRESALAFVGRADCAGILD